MGQVKGKNKSCSPLPYTADGRVYEDCTLDDSQLESLLIGNGMPRQAARVLVGFSGSTFGKNFTDYVVGLYGIRVNALLDQIDARYWKEDGREGRMEIWARRVGWIHTEAFLEDIWHPERGWETSIRKIHSVLTSELDRVLRKLRQGITLGVKAQERMSALGRRSVLPEDLKIIQDDYVTICACHMYLDGDDARPSERDMADFYGVNRSSLYRHLVNNFSITFKTLKAECEGRVKPMPIEELPNRFRYYFKQKQSEQATDTHIKK